LAQLCEILLTLTWEQHIKPAIIHCQVKMMWRRASSPRGWSKKRQIQTVLFHGLRRELPGRSGLAQRKNNC
jgi:hypothetical protein